MKNKSYARLAFKIALFYFIAASVCQSIRAQSEIRFRLVRDSLIVVSMMADKEGPFDFVLDTGADTTIVDPSLASKLSLAPIGRAQQSTLASAQTLTVSSLANLAAGRAQVENLTVLVQDLPGLRKMDSDIEGIAGQDFLSHFNYLIDYRKHSVRIEQRNEIRGSIEGDPVPIEVSGHRMIIASEAQSGRSANCVFCSTPAPVPSCCSFELLKRSTFRSKRIGSKQPVAGKWR
jgi:predicted aspartyl protease